MILKHILRYSLCLLVLPPPTCIQHIRGQDDPNTISLAGIMDTTEDSWLPDIFAVTAQLINEGFWPGTLKEGERLEYKLRNGMCDPTTAVRAYWELRTLNNSTPPHGIVGAYCSGASTSLARVSGLEIVPMVSPSSNTAQLSDNKEFPFFSRLVPPNDERGQVGALVALLREFGWNRVTVLATDTIFAKDLATEFRNAWVGGQGDWTGGEVIYSDTIRLTIDGAFDEDSAKQALEEIPTDDPSINSRIIFLAAHSQHAFKILQTAAQINFQPDTVWVGPAAWIGETPPTTDFSYLPPIPGYLGLAPYRNRDSNYQRFLEKFQDYERSNGKPITEELPSFAAETVDSIVALTKAISENGAAGRRDGQGIVRRLRQSDFGGVSGHVQLTAIGDRKDPFFSIVNAHSGQNGDIIWKEVGRTGIQIGSVMLTENEPICFPLIGCDGPIPRDSYPTPREKLPWWVIFLFLLFSVLCLAALLKYWRSRESKRRTKKQLKQLKEAFGHVRAAKCDYIPNTDERDGDVEEALDPSRASAIVSEKMAVWSWKETKQYMDTHNASEIFGDPKECWIKYQASCNTALEAAYLNKQRKESIPPWYVVDFKTMKQTKISTNFARDVQRIVVDKPARQHRTEREKKELVGVKVGDPLPDDLSGEPRMVLVKGDVVQISKQHQDGSWAFGTKLYHADAKRENTLVSMVDDRQLDVAADYEATIFTKGWFQMDVATRIPTTDDLQALGDTRILARPETWDKIVGSNDAKLYPLKQDGEERDTVGRAFMATVGPPRFNNVNIIKIERIQNLAMWQSYVVKRQTVCYRETGQFAADDEEHQRAVKRFERRWLWHGTAKDALEKILEQGFNRSFCGKNATQYGKGVYFARDASYSAYPQYAVPDSDGYQYMMACRVVVGEYCKGKKDALIPELRDSKRQLLYDTTVDSVSNPGVFVTYHDAQAYPEYLITFTSNVSADHIPSFGHPPRRIPY